MLEVRAVEGMNIGGIVSPGLMTTIFTIVQVIIAILIIYFLLYRFVLKPGRFKDEVMLEDVTGSGPRISWDKGYLKTHRDDGTSEYVLYRHKKAKLKTPDPTTAKLTQKGRLLYRFLKFGPGPYDFAQVNESFDEDGALRLQTIPLADEDWSKFQAKKAAEKKAAGNLFQRYSGAFITMGAIVVAMLIMMWTIGFVQETSQATFQNANFAIEKLDGIATALDNVAQSLGGGSSGGGGGGSTPPPGI